MVRGEGSKRMVGALATPLAPPARGVNCGIVCARDVAWHIDATCWDIDELQFDGVRWFPPCDTCWAHATGARLIAFARCRQFCPLGPTIVDR